MAAYLGAAVVFMVKGLTIHGSPALSERNNLNADSNRIHFRPLVFLEQRSQAIRRENSEIFIANAGGCVKREGSKIEVAFSACLVFIVLIFPFLFGDAAHFPAANNASRYMERLVVVLAGVEFQHKRNMDIGGAEFIFGVISD